MFAVFNKDLVELQVRAYDGEKGISIDG